MTKSFSVFLCFGNHSIYRNERLGRLYLLEFIIYFLVKWCDYIKSVKKEDRAAVAWTIN